MIMIYEENFNLKEIKPLTITSMCSISEIDKKQIEKNYFYQYI